MIFLKLLGILCVALGSLGIFVPILPTTPFLLLALYLFTKSSPQLKDKLLQNKILAPYIEAYQEGRPQMSKIVKIRTLAILWGSTTITAIFFTENIWVRILLLIMDIGVTIHILKMATKK